MEARLRSKTAAGTEGSPDALRGEYLRGAGLVSQTRRRIDGVAEAVAINLDDFSGLHAHLHLHRRTANAGANGFVQESLLDADAGRQRIALLRKTHKQPVTQQFDDAATVLLENLAQCPDQLRDKKRAVSPTSRSNMLVLPTRSANTTVVMQASSRLKVTHQALRWCRGFSQIR